MIVRLRYFERKLSIFMINFIGFSLQNKKNLITLPLDIQKK
jgi:hypothetical protein